MLKPMIGQYNYLYELCASDTVARPGRRLECNKSISSSVRGRIQWRRLSEKCGPSESKERSKCRRGGRVPRRNGKLIMSLKMLSTFAIAIFAAAAECSANSFHTNRLRLDGSELILRHRHTARSTSGPMKPGLLNSSADRAATPQKAGGAEPKSMPSDEGNGRLHETATH